MIKINKLTEIKNSKGNIIKLLNRNEPSFSSFGELYISKINFDKIKGWKRHKRMKMNLFVISGEVLFVFYYHKTKKFHTVKISNNKTGVFVPNNIWFAFKGISKKENIVMNFANIPHQDNEAEKKNINFLDFNWNNVN